MKMNRHLSIVKRNACSPKCLGISNVLLVLLLIAVAPVTISAGQIHSFTLPQQSYSDSRTREYKVYVPADVATPAPMVMALHGCEQNQDDVLNDWGLKKGADQYGFILVAPFITSYDGMRNRNCWGFWFDKHIHAGDGEVEDLHQIALQVEAHFSIDPQRRFITGLSSGGAMAIVAAVAHNEYWAAAATASALPYGEAAASVSMSGICPGGYASFHSVDQVVSDMQQEINDAYPIPTMVLQNKNDCTVLLTAANNIRDAHLKVFGTHDFDTAIKSKASDTSCSPFNKNNYDCHQIKYTQDGTINSRSLVETIIYDGPIATPNTQDTDHGHYWIGGTNGTNGKWSVKVGPSYPDITWDFFSRHGRDIKGHPIITQIGDNPMSVKIMAVFSDPGATATDLEDGSVSVNADCSAVNTSVVGSYNCIYSAIDSDNNTTSATRVVKVFDPNTPPETCQKISTPPSVHISAGRAYAGGYFDLRAFANGDDTDIGPSFNSWGSVTLYEGVSGKWYSQRPPACKK